MKTLLCTLFAFVIITGCNKTKEQRGEDLLMKLITSGQWVVTNYRKGGTNITADFSQYRFQFKENKTVDAIKNNTVEKTGTWDGSITNKTIISSFTNAAAPLMLLNGTWRITDSGLTFVEASQTVDGEERLLSLDKQ